MWHQGGVGSCPHDDHGADGRTERREPGNAPMSSHVYSQPQCRLAQRRVNVCSSIVRLHDKRRVAPAFKLLKQRAPRTFFPYAGAVPRRPATSGAPGCRCAGSPASGPTSRHEPGSEVERGECNEERRRSLDGGSREVMRLDLRQGGHPDGYHLIGRSRKPASGRYRQGPSGAEFLRQQAMVEKSMHRRGDARLGAEAN